MRVRRPRRGLYLRRRRLRRAVRDVVRDRVVEQHGLLRHDADLRAQRLQRDLANVAPIDRNRAAADVVKPRDQVHERGLAGAAAADDRHHLSRRHRQRDVAENRPRMHVLVRKADVAELDRPRERRQRHGVRRLRHLGVRVEHLEDALGCRNRLLQVGIHAAQLLRGRVHHQHRRQERREIARSSDGPWRSRLLPYHKRRGHADAAEQLHRRAA